LEKIFDVKIERLSKEMVKKELKKIGLEKLLIM
jgi:hypothetical protein